MLARPCGWRKHRHSGWGRGYATRSFHRSLPSLLDDWAGERPWFGGECGRADFSPCLTGVVIVVRTAMVSIGGGTGNPPLSPGRQAHAIALGTATGAFAGILEALPNGGAGTETHSNLGRRVDGLTCRGYAISYPFAFPQSGFSEKHVSGIA